MNNITYVLSRTDWALLAQQKKVLSETVEHMEQLVGIGSCTNLGGILNFIDAIQDAAEEDGYPVVFLEEEENTDEDETEEFGQLNCTVCDKPISADVAYWRPIGWVGGDCCLKIIDSKCHAS